MIQLQREWDINQFVFVFLNTKFYLIICFHYIYIFFSVNENCFLIQIIFSFVINNNLGMVYESPHKYRGPRTCVCVKMFLYVSVCIIYEILNFNI